MGRAAGAIKRSPCVRQSRVVGAPFILPSNPSRSPRRRWPPVLSPAALVSVLKRKGLSDYRVCASLCFRGGSARCAAVPPSGVGSSGLPLLPGLCRLLVCAAGLCRLPPASLLRLLLLRLLVLRMVPSRARAPRRPPWWSCPLPCGWCPAAVRMASPLPLFGRKKNRKKNALFCRTYWYFLYLCSRNQGITILS